MARTSGHYAPWYTRYAALAADASVALAARFFAQTVRLEIVESGAREFNFIGTMASVVQKLPISPRLTRASAALVAASIEDIAPVLTDNGRNYRGCKPFAHAVPELTPATTHPPALPVDQRRGCDQARSRGRPGS